MKNYLKEKFGLTEEGAIGLTKASIASFFMFIFNMFPAILLMFFIQDLFLNQVRETWVYISISLSILIIMYIMLNIEYELQYNETYKEAAHLRISLSKKLAQLPMSYYAKHDLSDLAQTIIADINTLEHALSHALPKAVAMAFYLPILLILLLIGNWKMAVAATLPTMISYIFIILSRSYTTKEFNKYYVQLRKNSDLFQENIELAREINAFNLRDTQKRDLFKTMDESEKIHWESELKAGILMLIAGILSQISLPFTILVGLKLLSSGEINILYFIGYLLAEMKLKEAVDGNSEFFMELYNLSSSSDRIKEIMNHEVQDGINSEFDNYDIEVKNLDFSYDASEKVIDNLSFIAKQGEVTALVGPSGCGKTSVLRLVSRLYDYDGGSVKIGNKDIKEVSTESLYQNISIVFQDVKLFNTSIMENIRIGNKNASDDEVIYAAKLANCDFIDKLDNGFDTLIGENGSELSGGERQRISIARAFLKDAPILILDEIASSLDVDNESKIQSSLNKLIKNKTVIVISHRMKSIENASKILVIDKGELVGEGPHSDLLKTSELYKKLIEKTQAAENFVY